MFTRIVLVAGALVFISGATVMAADKPAAAARMTMEGEKEGAVVTVERPVVRKEHSLSDVGFKAKEKKVETEMHMVREHDPIRTTGKPASDYRLSRE